MRYSRIGNRNANAIFLEKNVMENLLYWAGMLAVAVNALTGVLDAGRKRMDLIGVMMVGAATALGGGTVRDLLLDRPVFWIGDQTYLVVALATTLAVKQVPYHKACHSEACRATGSSGQLSVPVPARFVWKSLVAPGTAARDALSLTWSMAPSPTAKPAARQ